MPIKVIETGSQREVEVSAAEAKAMLDAGAAILPAGKVRVIREGNRTGSVDAASLDQALAEGWQLADDEQVAEAKVRRDAESVAGTLQGGFESAARGISFGATDYLARQAGVDMEAMRARQEALGGLGTAVELGGSLLTGSAIAKGVTKAGQLGARAAGVDLASGLTAPAAPSLARTTAHVAGQGAVEGFAAGAGKEVSEASLGDRDLVASQVLAQGGYGALFGAGAGTLIPGIAAAGAGLARVPVRAVKSVLGKATSASDDGSTLVTQIIGSDKATREARARMYAAGTGQDPERMVRLFDDIAERPDPLTRAAADVPRFNEEVAESLRQPAEAMRTANANFRQAMSGEHKARQVERLLAGGSNDDFLRSHELTIGKFDEIDGAVSAAIRDGGRDPLTGARLPGLATKSHAIEDLAQIKQLALEARKEAADAAAEITGRSAKPLGVAAYTAADRFKQGIFTVRAALQKAVARSGDRAAQNTLEVVDDVYNRLRTHLEDSAAWPERVAAAQRDINGATAAAIHAEDMLGRTASSRILDPLEALDSGDLLSVARQFRRYSGTTKTEMLDDYISKRIQWARTIAKHYDMSPVQRTALREMESASEGFAAAMGRQRESARMADDLSHVKNVESNGSVSTGITTGVATFVGGALGSFFGGPLGAAIGAVAAQAFRPYSVVRKLAAIQARMSGAGAAQTKAIGDFLERVSTGASRQIEKRSRLAGRASSDYAAKEAARKESLAQTRKRTSELLADPAHMAEQIRRMTADLEDVAPNVATAIGDNVRRTVTYLAAKQPKTYQAAWSSSPPLVDPVDEARYERCVEGALRPWEALAKLTIGAFTKEHAEALQFCHPAIFKMEQTRILEAMATAKANKKSIPLEDASQISVFFNVPADPTLALAPGIAIAMTPSAQQEAGPAPTPRGNKSEPIDSARYETPVQQIGQIK